MHSAPAVPAVPVLFIDNSAGVKFICEAPTELGVAIAKMIEMVIIKIDEKV